MSETLQYTIVGIILIAVCVWLVIKVTQVLRGKSTGCDCCALSKTCASKGKVLPPHRHNIAKPATGGDCDACKAARN